MKNVSPQRTQRAQRQKKREYKSRFVPSFCLDPLFLCALCALCGETFVLLVQRGGWAGYLMQTVLASVKKRRASSPPSRPTPDDLTPPNGTRRSRSSQQLTPTVPHSSCSP